MDIEKLIKSDQEKYLDMTEKLARVLYEAQHAFDIPQIGWESKEAQFARPAYRATAVNLVSRLKTVGLEIKCI